MQVNKNLGNRRQQWFLLWIMVLTVALGWKYPLMGFAVPVVIITGLTISFFRGRYLCGNLCPRGSFMDKVMVLASPSRNIPAYVRNMWFRRAVVLGLIGFMFYRGFQEPLNPYHWGNVFWMLCAVTTGVAIFLGLFVHQRTWCSFCPISTLQNIIGGGSEHLQIDGERCRECRECRECRLCEDVCAINLSIIAHKDSGELANRDCLKCSKCIGVCPSGALSWPTGGRNTKQKRGIEMLTKARNIFAILLLLCLFITGCALTGTTTLTTRNGIMETSSSSLMWQQDRGPLFTSWEEANNYVNKLALGGYSDWRLPTREEFLKLYFAFDYGSANTNDLGIVIEGNFWSAEKGGMGFSGAWKDGDSCEISRDYKLASKGYVRAVRHKKT